MKLASFSVTNFRSITSAYKITISDKIVLIGKNNEGKSNLLKALNIAMTILDYYSETGGPAQYSRKQRSRNLRIADENVYWWERDFPISKRKPKSTSGQSILRITFELTEQEIIDFHQLTKSRLDGFLPIEIEIGYDGILSCKVAKKGKGANTLTSKLPLIAAFVCDRININYIPAIRTNNESMTIIRRMLGSELTELEVRDDYKAALKTINDLQKPILQKLENNLQESLKVFLPSISSVQLETSEENRRHYLRSEIKLIINDGIPTDIEYKGDGVKSLVALSLLNSLPSTGNTIVIIEEPESHLHPEAIHNLCRIIDKLSEDNQVILSTHNPLFVDRKTIKKNILVDKGKAIPARNISEIRGILGVRVSDNLFNANFVLLVEGESDCKALLSLLPFLSKKLEKVISDKILVIKKMCGAGNLIYELNNMKSLLCTAHVFLDNDVSGRQAYDIAEKANLIKMKDVNFTICNGMPQAEFEDCLNESLYKDEILQKYNVSINSSRCNNKWSERMKSAFLANGKIWNQEIEDEIKELVANCVEANPSVALNDHKRGSIDSLVKELEDLVK